MIVCVCKSVSDRTIRASIADGTDSFDELQFELGVGTCCGRCVESVRDVLEQSGVCAARCGVAHAPAVTAPAAEPVMFYELKAA